MGKKLETRREVSQFERISSLDLFLPHMVAGTILVFDE
jgi:hypothetical protein